MKRISPLYDTKYWIKELEWAVNNQELIRIGKIEIYYSYEIISSNGADFVLFIPNRLNTPEFRKQCLSALKADRDVCSCKYVLLDDLEEEYADA